MNCRVDKIFLKYLVVAVALIQVLHQDQVNSVKEENANFMPAEQVEEQITDSVEATVEETVAQGIRTSPKRTLKPPASVHTVLSVRSLPWALSVRTMFFWQTGTKCGGFYKSPDTRNDGL